jgi:hypothetical protein
MIIQNLKKNKNMILRNIFFIFSITASTIIARGAISQEEHVQEKIAYIQRAKQAVLIDLRDTYITGRKAKLIAKSVLGDRYPILKFQVKNAIDNIIYSEEFLNAVYDVIAYQMDCIREKDIAFEDITYEENNTLVRKIDVELKTIFPELNEDVNTLFNIFYVAVANCRVCKILLDQLKKEEDCLKKMLV